MIISEQNTIQAQTLFRGTGLKIFTESLYLSGYISDLMAQAICIGEKVDYLVRRGQYIGRGGVIAPTCHI